MAIVVEHTKRKKQILSKALDVFIEEGFENATFQKIADKCKVTRTTLYTYFKNKREIFLWSIKQMMSALEVSILAIANNCALSASEQCEKILFAVIDSAEKNTKLLNVLLLYVLELKKQKVNVRERIARRVVKLKHVLSTVLIRGMKTSELKKMNVKDMNDIFYSLIEAAIFRLTVFGEQNISDIRESISFSIKNLQRETEK